MDTKETSWVLDTEQRRQLNVGNEMAKYEDKFSKNGERQNRNSRKEILLLYDTELKAEASRIEL